MHTAHSESNATFSQRHGYEASDAEISIRLDAPPELRDMVATIAYESGLRPKTLRPIVCRVLRRREDTNNWSEYPNIDGELRYLLQECEWYEVYDVIEAVSSALQQSQDLRADGPSDAHFEVEMNKYFRRRGVGWQLDHGRIEIRGPESFEQVVAGAQSLLKESGRATAANELHEAIVDLSRRPAPDITGAIQHALACAECVARDVSGDEKATLGQILARHPGLVPAPLDVALEKMWGYASEQGRHLREGREPGFEEAELAVHLAAAVSRYLTRKSRG